MRGTGLVRAPADPLPGHPQMGEKTLAAVERQQHPFSEALDPGEAVPGQAREPRLRLAADDA